MATTVELEMTAEAPRPAHAPTGERPQPRDEILEAAVELLLSTGSVEALSLAALARAMGAPVALSAFPERQMLIREVRARYLAALDEAVDAAIAGIDDPVDRLAARGRAYIHFGSANPEPYQVAFMTKPDHAGSGSPDDGLVPSRTFDDLAENVQACLDTGRFRPNADDPFRVCLTWWAMAHGLVSLTISNPFLRWPQDDFVDRYIDDYIHSIVA